MTMDYPALHAVARTYPAIDNHAHPLLKATNRESIPFEVIISEASGPALLQDSPHTLACYRATAQLAVLHNLEPETTTWDQIKHARSVTPYDSLCSMSMDPARIQCILLDDGLGGVEELCEDYEWHDRLTVGDSPCKRIVRVEVVAQDILKDLIHAQLAAPSSTSILDAFTSKFPAVLELCASYADVAGFKSVACYRTGLNVSPSPCTPFELEQSLAAAMSRYLNQNGERNLRLEDKALNDWIVRTTCEVAAVCGKPLQFHTGLGDNDITLTLSSPAHLQPLIKAYPDTKIILLHSSYPYTRDAGYLTAVYRNVYLDFGEIFPFVSGEGQRAVIRQVLELAPTNKIMWSTDGHWWPESYYLGTLQAREALYEVLAESIRRKDLNEQQAIGIVKNALFHNANKIYNLGLTPHLSEP